jgi:NAD(P)H-nitrite reductase large subunit
MEYLIVGGSIAAASGLAAIRRNKPSAEIRVIADEPVPFYYRPLIPFLLDGSRTAEEILFAEHPPTAWGAELLHDQCVGIDPEKHTIRLRSGKELGYGKLLLAAGGAPVLLLNNLAGADSEGVFTLRSLEDAVKIRQYLPRCKTAAVIGGGLVGIKAAEALLRAGLAVTVIEQQAHILPLRADAFAADAVAARLRQKGMTILTNESPLEIMAQAGRVSGVRLASGGTAAADMVVLAVGVRPNTDFLRGAGLKIERGVVVDRQMRTSVPDIYAAGDLIQFVDQADGRAAVSGLWSNAVHSGRVAGCCMSGGQAALPPLLSVMNSMEIAGLSLLSAGLIDDPAGCCAVFAEMCGDNYRKLIFEQDRLVGMIFLGNTERAGVYANLIRNRVPLGGKRDAVVRDVMRAMMQ